MLATLPQIAHSIAYFLIFGKPFILYAGIITYLAFVFAASIPLSRRYGIRWFPFSWHRPAALVAIVLATFHGLIALLSNL
jgi:hypothetical protein